MRLCELPVELVWAILRHLDPVDVDAAAGACRWLRRVASDPLLRQTLDLHRVRFERRRVLPSEQALLRWLRRAPRLRWVRLTRELCSERVVAQLRLLEGLQHADFGFCVLEGQGEAVRALVGERANGLRGLGLEGTEVGGLLEGVAPGALQGLRCLDLTHCTGVPSGRELARMAPKLKVLRVDGVMNWTDADVAAVCGPGALHELTLDGFELGAGALVAVARCKGLRTLRVSFSGDFGARDVEALRSLRHMQHLTLRKGGETFGSLEALLGGLAELNTLDITECMLVDDAALKGLSHVARGLTQLNISWCWSVTDDGLLSCVYELPRLVKLDVTGIKGLTDMPFQPVVEGTALLQLRVLLCKNVNQVSDELLDAVNALIVERHGRDQAVVVNYYGFRLSEEFDEDAGFGAMGTLYVDGCEIKSAALPPTHTRYRRGC